MTYIEELFSQGYISATPRDKQDILLMPKGVINNGVQSLYVDRDIFLNTLKKQRNDGVNEVLLVSILNATEKQDFSIFSTISDYKPISDIYLEKVHNWSEHNIESTNLIDRNIIDLLGQEDNDHNIATSHTTNTSLSYTSDFNHPDENNTRVNIDGTTLLSIEKKITALYDLLCPNIDTQDNKAIVDNVHKPSEEEIEVAREYADDLNNMQPLLNQLATKGYLTSIFSLEDTPEDTKFAFLQGVSNLLPLLQPSDKIKVLNALSYGLMGETFDDNQFLEVIDILTNSGLTNYKFTELDNLYKIFINFFYQDKED